jgi:hypothetical protein
LLFAEFLGPVSRQPNLGQLPFLSQKEL